MTIIGHEKKGGIIVEVDTIRATVSPFSLLPVATVRPPKTRGRADAPQNGHAPPARIFRNGAPLVPEPVKKKKSDGLPQQPVESDALTRLRNIGGPSVAPPPAQATPPPITPPLGKGGVEAFFARWLRDWRRATPHPGRQALIDHFNLPVYLRDRVPVEPGLFHYRQCVYFIAAATLADPARVPPLPDVQVTVSARFRVTEEAVKVHLKWMTARLRADHAKFAATHPAPVGVPQ